MHSTAFEPGDRVQWLNDDGVMERGKVAATPRQDPWLSYGRVDHVMVHRGEDPCCEDSFRTLDAAELIRVEWRCACCDGPDGLGFVHVLGIEGLRRAILNANPGPFAVQDFRSRSMMEVTAAEAVEVILDWDRVRAETAADTRAGEGGR